jgi:hypothetical protein
MRTISFAISSGEPSGYGSQVINDGNSNAHIGWQMLLQTDLSV